MDRKLCLVWPAQAVITESLFRHYSMLAEVAGYLVDSSIVFKELHYSLSIEDCAVVPHTAMNMAKIVHNNNIIAIAINMNNVKEALDTATFFKSVDTSRIIIAYGEAVACNSKFFSEQVCFDYVIEGGQFELGIEALICHIEGIAWECYNHDIKKDNYHLNGKLLLIDRTIVLPVAKWGMPKLELLPMDFYLRIGGGEIHITACKGCPFDCEFCNEVYVSTRKIRYRKIEEIVEYLCNNNYSAKSVYLDSSTFTYDKNWVISLCKALIKVGKPIIPWKTCTRLDCLDDDLLYWMGRANCTRISIGVESISLEIQQRNHKVIENEKLKRFSKECIKNGILPRALMIIGLKGQDSTEIEKAQRSLNELGIQTRFRVLQDYDFMTKGGEISIDDFEKLNRWLVNSPMPELGINTIRAYEYPQDRNEHNFA